MISQEGFFSHPPAETEVQLINPGRKMAAYEVNYANQVNDLIYDTHTYDGSRGNTSLLSLFSLAYST